MTRTSTARLDGFTSRLKVRRKDKRTTELWNGDTGFSCRILKRYMTNFIWIHVLDSPVTPGVAPGGPIRTFEDALREAHRHHRAFVKGVSP